MNQKLFDYAIPESIEGDPLLGQYFTPEWAAQLLVERYFTNLCSSDLVVEPSCGTGAFIKAIPEDVPVIGVEIDPALAALARANTGREIITGAFETATLPDGVTAVVGNPPFEMEIVERFLKRAHGILPTEGRCGLLLPAYHFQTFNRVLRWNERWSLAVEMLPRDLFRRIHLPLAFAMFRKDQRREMFGLALYGELAAIDNLAEAAQEVLKNGRPRVGAWRALVEETLKTLGGRASLTTIYQHIEPRRPTRNRFWQEKVRQQLQLHFHRTGPGEWAIA